MGEVIAVLSGKGGTGKTSISAAVCTALARGGRKVLAIDCDMGLQNLDISLAMSDSGALSFLDVCEGGYTLEQAAVHPEFPTLQFLTAPVCRSALTINRESFKNMLDRGRVLFDYVFLDAPAGLDAGFELAARFADRIILVTGADPAAVRDAARAGQVLERMGKTQIKLIVNRVNPRMYNTMNITIDDVMDDAGLPLLGVVPEDKNVTLAAAFSRPLIRYTNRGAARACTAIAQRIQGLNVPLTLK